MAFYIIADSASKTGGGGFPIQWFVIGQFGSSSVLPPDTKGKLAIESEHQNISTWYNFIKNSLLNHTTCIVMVRLLCFESERKGKNCNIVAEKLDLEYLLSTISYKVFQICPLNTNRASSWVSAMNGTASDQANPVFFLLFIYLFFSISYLTSVDHSVHNTVLP